MNRRRMMIESDENPIIYIDSGFLEQKTSTAFSKPTVNETFTLAWSTTSIELQYMDEVIVESNVVNTNQRVRVYGKDGSYVASIFEGFNFVKSNPSDDYKYYRLLSLNVGNLTSVAVKHTDGSITNYKIVDRR